jgi:hypothetical protein
MGSSQFSDIVNLSQEVAQYLQSAIDNLDKVHVPEEDKELVAENVISNLSAFNQEFIQLWKTFETVLDKVDVDLDSTPTDQQLYGPMAILEAAYNSELINESQLNEGKELIDFRNRLVHGVPTTIHEHEIEAYSRRLDRYIGNLRSVLGPVSFHEECISGLENHLGCKLIERSRTTYISDNSDLRLSCAVSKAYSRGGQVHYWFGFHRNQKQFLEETTQSYVTFGCGTENNLLLIPFVEFSNFLNHMSVTEKDNRYYWHVHISQKDGSLLLLQSGLDSIKLDQYLIP